MEPRIIQTIKEEQDDGYSQDPCVVGTEIEAVDGDLKDMDNDEYSLKAEIDDAELSKPFPVPVGAEPDVERKPEGTLVEHLETTEMMEDTTNREHTMKKDTDYSETLMDPLFVLIKTEPDFQGTSEDTTVEESFETFEDTEGPEKSQCPFVESNAQNYSLQVTASSSQTPSSQKKFLKNFPSRHESALLQKEEPFAVASCSSADNAVSQEEAADTYVLKSEVELNVAVDIPKQNSDKCEDRRCSNSADGGSFECSQCGKPYKTKLILKEHMRIHTGDRPFKCCLCTKSFAHRSSLSIHKRTHSGDQPYKCSQCAKSFTSSSNLTSHMRIHTTDRPYKCLQCGKSFTQSSHLTIHKRTHSGDQPYKCSLCAKSFMHKNSLTVHMRTHTGDQPYKCSQCGRSFSQSCNLTKHKRRHKGV